MRINLDYAAEERPQGTFVKPFCYAVEDADAPVRDANYALKLVRKFTERLPGEYGTVPPPEGWRLVFRIVIAVEGVRKGVALYDIEGYRRFAFDGRFNGVCEGYMDLYRTLKGIVRRAKGRSQIGHQHCRAANPAQIGHQHSHGCESAARPSALPKGETGD